MPTHTCRRCTAAEVDHGQALMLHADCTRGGRIASDLRVSRFLVSGRSAVRIRSPALGFRRVIPTSCLPSARSARLLGLLGLGQLGPSSLSHRIGQGALSLIRRVQIYQRGALAIVPHPDHKSLVFAPARMCQPHNGPDRPDQLGGTRGRQGCDRGALGRSHRYSTRRLRR
jgi:hypothetical protein